MSKLIGLLVAVGVSGVAIAEPAFASNLEVLKAQDQQTTVTLVRDGCGRGWFRDRWGRCHRERPIIYYERPYVYERPYYGPYYHNRPLFWHHGW